MLTPKVVTLQEQLQMVQEWEIQPGQQRWGTAHLILKTYKKPMTQEDFIRVEGLSDDLDDVLENLEEEIEDGTLPPWFGQLPSA